MYKLRNITDFDASVVMNIYHHLLPRKHIHINNIDQHIQQIHR